MSLGPIFVAGGSVETITVRFLLIGGGASGQPGVDGHGSAGGGAGGFLDSDDLSTAPTVTKGVTYFGSVGAKGSGSTTNSEPGGPTSFLGYAVAGGVTLPGIEFITSQGTHVFGVSGPSGSGAMSSNTATPNGTVLGGLSVKSRSEERGNRGGNVTHQSTGSGGGGAGGAGADTSSQNNGSNGGAGYNSDITGSSVPYAAGGGGSASTTGGSGGSGIGGTGGRDASRTGGNATANRGSGGGGGYSGGNAGGDGSGGVVIVRFPTAGNTLTATGNYSTATTGSDTVVTFTAGDFTFRLD